MTEEKIITSGKIYKKGYIYTLLLFIALLTVILVAHKKIIGGVSLKSCFTEIFGVLATIVILLFGKIYYSKKNDLLASSKYYNHAKTYLLFAMLIGFVISRAFSFIRNREVNPIFNYGIYMILGISYFYYQFKVNNININYAFIGEVNKEYYKRVLKNTLKIVLTIIISFLCCTVFATPFCTEVSALFSHMLTISLILSLILSTTYLILSVVEKIEYSKESQNFKPSVLILILISLTFKLIQTICEIVQYLMIISDDYLPSYQIISEKLTNIASHMQLLAIIYTIITITYFISHFSKSKLVKNAFQSIIVCMSLGGCLQIFSNQIIMFIDFDIRMTFIQICNMISRALELAQIILVFAAIIGLIKSFKYSKLLSLVTVGHFVTLIIYIIARSLRIDILNVFIASTGILFVSLVFGLLVYFIEPKIPTFNNIEKIEKDDEYESQKVDI